ncbi:hypothetical protein M0804_013121 [Polistes exclamans]|nr:hypothetical protein M0804_013121 [Polistes exclamans]
MTGHDCFPAYLCRIGKLVGSGCFHCDCAVDNAEHTLIVCPAWDEAKKALRRELRGMQLSLPGIVRNALATPGRWAAFQSFSGLVIREKERAERAREREIDGGMS